MAGPPVNLTKPRHPQLLGVVGCCQQTETYPPGPPDTPYLGSGVTLHHVRAPCDIIIGRHIMALSSSWSESVTQTGPGEVESDRSLTQAPGQPAGWAGLGGGGGVSGCSPGWMSILMLAAPLIATPPNPRRLWVQRGQGQWEESLIPQQDGTGCQTLAQD